MTLETVYIETTIASYLVAAPSRDLIVAAEQEITRTWWLEGRLQYRCVTSDEVLREASLGDPTLSRQRLEALVGMASLQVDDAIRALAKGIMEEKLLPPSAIADALHAATASWYHTDYLLTWNCRHLANPHLQKRLRAFMDAHRLSLPEICTPVELTGG